MLATLSEGHVDIVTQTELVGETRNDSTGAKWTWNLLSDWQTCPRIAFNVALVKWGTGTAHMQCLFALRLAY